MELLTSIGAIAILLALVIHAATAVRTNADKATEMAAARALGVAWSMYSTDHQGAVLPGYVGGFRARNLDGEWIDDQTADVAAKRWPLRLAPYLGHDFAALYSGEASRALEGLSELPTSEALYLVSTFPAFGLNSVFLGGDENHGGYSDVFLDTFGPFYRTRLSNIRHPDRLVVFATSRAADTGPGGNGEVREGFFRVLPPNWAQPLWDDVVDPEDPSSAGFLSDRHRSGDEDVAIVTTVDGGVSVESIEGLRDMRRWSDDAGHADWKLEPVLP